MFSASNICNFKEGNIIHSIFSGVNYKVINHNKNGMAVLLNLKTGHMEDWNAYNNSHFILLSGQLNLFV